MMQLTDKAKAQNNISSIVFVFLYIKTALCLLWLFLWLKAD